MIFEIKEPTKKIKDICSELGSDYSIQVIDGEQVIYRKVNHDYDIEISGLNNNRKDIKPTIYLWRLKPGVQVVETINNINSLESLKTSLTSLVEKYQNL